MGKDMAEHVLAIVIALAIGLAFAEPRPPDAPSRVVPLRLKVTLELSVPAIELAEVRP